MKTRFGIYRQGFRNMQSRTPKVVLEREPVRVELGYRQVEAVCAAVAGVPADKRGAFKARLRHLQTLGFPPGTNTGKGRRAAYSISNLLQLAIAMELAQAGVGPLRTVRLVMNSWRSLADAIVKGAGTRDVWVVRPAALIEGAGDADGRYVDAFEMTARKDLQKLFNASGFRPGVDIPWRALVLDGGAIVKLVLKHLQDVMPNVNAEACEADLKDEIGDGDDSKTAVDEPKRRDPPKLASDLSRRERKAPVETV